MVQECAHLYENGRNCRRIPKRGDRLCPAHHSGSRRLEEDEAFRRHMFRYVNYIKVMPLADLLYTTGAMLADIHSLIDRRSTRGDRLAYRRALASVAVAVAADRLRQMDLDHRQHPEPAQPTPTQLTHAQPTPIRPPQAAPFPNRLSQQQEQQLQYVLDHTPQQLAPDHLEGWIDNLLSILDSNSGTTSTSDSNA
jgi:hypothetical protein